MKHACIIALALVMAFAGTGVAQELALGTIDFPNSGSAEAQSAFLDGVRMVHSFEWEDAIEKFQEAQKLDPDFFMAYWGEALSHYEGHHFSSSSTDLPGGREALEKLGKTRKERLAKAPTNREHAYMEAVEELFGGGTAEERTLAYSEAMGRLSTANPEDHEAASLYSLSLMRTKVRGPDSVREDMQAGAIAQMVFRANPDHPGAAHYVIHAYDDPVHAPIALYAAHKYSEIAPSAVHALHMPAHIFVQHGMWDHVVERNTESYDASVARAKRKGISDTRHSWHALYWLQYGYLQQGQYDKAQGTIEEIRPIAGRNEEVRRVGDTLNRMESLQTVETEKWRVRNIDGVLEQIRGTGEINERSAAAVLLATGMSAAKTGDMAGAQKASDGLKDLTAKMEEGEAGREQVEITWIEMQALIADANGKTDEALTLMKKASAIAETMVPPSGPPGEAATDTPVKPPHELYGEMLLAHGKSAEALEQFKISLLRTPNRVRSLLGAARAADKVGDEKMARLGYEGVARIGGAGPDLPGHDEAEQYLQSSSEDN